MTDRPPRSTAETVEGWRRDVLDPATATAKTLPEYDHPAALAHGTEITNVMAPIWPILGRQPELAICETCGGIIAETHGAWAHVPELYYSPYDLTMGGHVWNG